MKEDLWRAESESKKTNFRETNEEHRWTHFIHPHHWRLHQRRNMIFFVLQLKDISCGLIWEQKCPLIVWLSICEVFQHHTPVDSSRKLSVTNRITMDQLSSSKPWTLCLSCSYLNSNIEHSVSIIHKPFFSKSNYSLKGSRSIKIKWFQYYDVSILLVTNPTSFCRKTVVLLKAGMLIALNCSVHRLAECD